MLRKYLLFFLVLLFVWSCSDEETLTEKPEIAEIPAPPEPDSFPSIVYYGNDQQYEEILISDEKRVLPMPKDTFRLSMSISLDSNDVKNDLGISINQSPTNGLNIPSRYTVQLFTEKYEGWMIAVTHNDDDIPKFYERGDRLLPITDFSEAAYYVNRRYNPYKSFPPDNIISGHCHNTCIVKDNLPRHIMVFKVTDRHSPYLIRLRVREDGAVVIDEIKNLRIKPV